MLETIPLRISVDIDGVEQDEDRACAILFFTTGQLEEQFYDALQYSPQICAPLLRGTETPYSLSIRSKPKFPTYLHLYVFVTNSNLDENHAPSEIHRGSGKIFIQTLLSTSLHHTIQIYDSTNHNSIGHVTVTLNSPRSGGYFSFFSKASSQSGDIHSLIKQCKALYDNNSYSYDADKQVFYAITTPVGDLPLIAWPVLATQVGYVDYDAQLFLTRLAKIAFQLQGYGTSDYSILEKLSPDELSDLLGEMLTLVSRTTLYVPDYLRKASRGSQTTSTDQWSRPGTFPRPECVAVDCEDSSNHVQEILYVLQHVKLVENHDFLLLSYMQHVANQYVSALTLGTLYEAENKYSGHAYVICLPKDYMATVIQAKLANTRQWEWHCLAIETTNHNQSIWSESYWQSNDSALRSNYEEETAFMDSIGSEKWERLLRYRTPAKIICDQTIYGEITQLHTTDGLSLACVSHDRTKLGVKAKDLLLLKLDSTNFHIISQVNEHTKKQLGENLPPSIFLRHPLDDSVSTDDIVVDIEPARKPPPMFVIEEDEEELASTTSSKARFSMRTIDFRNEHKELHALLKSKGKKNIKYTDIPLYEGLTDNGSLTLIEFDLTNEKKKMRKRR